MPSSIPSLQLRVNTVLGSITWGSTMWERYERWRLNRFRQGALKRSSVCAWTQRSKARAPERISSEAWQCNLAPSGIILTLAMQIWRWNKVIHMGTESKGEPGDSTQLRRVTATWNETFSRSRVFWLNSYIFYLFSSSGVCSGKKSSSHNAAWISLLIHLFHAKSFFILM